MAASAVSLEKTAIAASLAIGVLHAFVTAFIMMRGCCDAMVNHVDMSAVATSAKVDVVRASHRKSPHTAANQELEHLRPA